MFHLKPEAYIKSVCRAWWFHYWGEERQQHLSFLADEAEKTLRFTCFFSLQIGLAHDDLPHRRGLYFGLSIRHSKRILVDDDVLHRRRALFQGQEACCFARVELRRARAIECLCLRAGVEGENGCSRKRVG